MTLSIPAAPRATGTKFVQQTGSSQSRSAVQKSPGFRVSSCLLPPCRNCLKKLRQNVQAVKSLDAVGFHKRISSVRPMDLPRDSVYGWKALSKEGTASTRQMTVMAAEGAVRFPEDYDEVLEQVKASTAAALKDKKELIEIEFPTAGLESVAGDEEGTVEMNLSMTAIREFCKMFVETDQGPKIRVFFPDQKEAALARRGLFEGTPFKIDFLTSPSGLSDIGWEKKVNIADKVRPSDEVFVVAYPYFNVNEMIAVEELWRTAAGPSERPIVVFNGELDRIRTGYYPPFFYPKLGQLAKTFLPKFEAAYYIHNFKGQLGGKLFRAYPGPWQVLRRDAQGQLEVVQETEEMPTLKEVALNILPMVNIGI